MNTIKKTLNKLIGVQLINVVNKFFFSKNEFSVKEKTEIKKQKQNKTKKKKS